MPVVVQRTPIRLVAAIVMFCVCTLAVAEVKTYYAKWIPSGTA